ncbi:MAG: DUF4364 family protein [Eubacteriales bacterium]|nr:DUF4364 family protein [Eubacteriales bacterium]
MNTNGLIHNETDMKLLILYILKRLPGPVDKESLFEICVCDNGVEYFDFSDYLHELVENGHIAETDEEEYVITGKGIRNGEAVESSLPKSVRVAADRALAPVAVEIKRHDLIKTSETKDDNGVTVHLSVSDGEVSLLNMDIYCGDEARAHQIRRSFRKKAEEKYGKILELLTEK